MRLAPISKREFQFPPSQFSFHTFDRLLYGIFWWMPEIKFQYRLPEIFTMLRPSSHAAGGFILWSVLIVRLLWFNGSELNELFLLRPGQCSLLFLHSSSATSSPSCLSPLVLSRSEALGHRNVPVRPAGSYCIASEIMPDLLASQKKLSLLFRPGTLWSSVSSVLPSSSFP